MMTLCGLCAVVCVCRKETVDWLVLAHSLSMFVGGGRRRSLSLSHLFYLNEWKLVRLLLFGTNQQPLTEICKHSRTQTYNICARTRTPKAQQTRKEKRDRWTSAAKRRNKNEKRRKHSRGGEEARREILCGANKPRAAEAKSPPVVKTH